MKPLETVTGTRLMTLELPQPPPLVEGLLYPGLTVLAGKPKLGKSFLMLELALALAAGRDALGSRAATRGEVLYLAIEDTYRRLQSRLQLLGGTVPEGLHFGTRLEPLDQGGFEQLGGFLRRHLGVKLVVLDTLARVKPRRQARADIYQEDAALGARLQALAAKFELAMVVVHHLRKAPAEDVLDTVSGSLGFTGAADCVLVLSRSRGQAQAVLNVMGRDVDEQQLALTFKGGRWTVLGTGRRSAMSPERRAILECLEASPAPLRASEVAERVPSSYDSVRHLLRRLFAEGLVHSDSSNRYRPVPG